MIEHKNNTWIQKLNNLAQDFCNSLVQIRLAPDFIKAGLIPRFYRHLLAAISHIFGFYF